MTEGLNARLDELRVDYESVRGYPFEHFFCPFLHVDEPVPLCKGHIINEAFGTCNLWVPQRQDVDNFFGSKVEADFISAVQDRRKSAFEKWIDPKLNRRYRPQLVSKGVGIEYYLTKEIKSLPGQTPLVVTNSSGDILSNIVLKKDPNEVKQLHAQDMQVVAVPPATFIPAIIASVLKAAHLTMFNLFGYRHVFSAVGLYLAEILRTFFEKFKETKKKSLATEVAAAFRPHASVISPTILNNPSVLAGTVIDNRVLVAIGGSEGPFAMGVLIPASINDAFCVWLPSCHGKTIDTYLGFLKEPPTSIRVKLLQFVPANDQENAHWATSMEEPIPLELNAKQFPQSPSGDRPDHGVP
jgi:hypothetical protein